MSGLYYIHHLGGVLKIMNGGRQSLWVQQHILIVFADEPNQIASEEAYTR